MFHKTPDFWFVQPQMQNAYSYAVNNPVKYNDPSGEVVPLLAAWAAFEVSMAVYDTYDLAHTLSNKNASTQTKAVTVGAYAAGLYLPGGGYGTLGKQAIKQADEAVAMVKNAPEVGKVVVEYTNATMTRAYDTFVSYKKSEGIASANNDLHHIVGQTMTNIQQFGPKAIHNTSNIVEIPREVHHEINRLYQSVTEYSRPSRVYEWIGKQSFSKQYDFGKRVMNDAFGLFKKGNKN